MRSLQQMRMIHREREQGSRRDVYVVADDAWHDVMMNSANIYAPLTQSLREGVDQVGGRARRPATGWPSAWRSSSS